MKIVHIGFPKTATTFLQHSLFPELNSQSCCFHYSKETSDFFFKLAYEDDTNYSKELAYKQLKGICDSNKHNLFSWEPLTGMIETFGFPNRSLIARRLEELGFDKIIVVLRNQAAIIESTYKEYVQQGGVLTLNRFFNSFIRNRNAYFDIGYYEYDKLVELYVELFQSENVFVLQYENLQEPGFLSEILKELGAPENATINNSRINYSLSATGTRLLRIINFVTYSKLRPTHLISKRINSRTMYKILRLVFKDYRSNSTLLTAPQIEKINNYYRPSNQRLKENYLPDLGNDYAT